MNKSWKHHYLPEFYLKGFTNDDGQLSIYDCQRKLIKKGEYMPSTHFWEENRNTINTERGQTDFLERFYSKIDNRHSQLLQFIQKTNKVPNLNEEQMSMLQEFVLTTFWRLPKNDEFYTNEFSKSSTFTNFTKNFKLIDTTSGLDVEDEELEKFKSSPSFIKSARGLAQFASILGTNKSFDFHNWRITYTPKGFNFCSDNPILVKDGNVKNILETDFIFPLTKNHELIRTLKTLPIKSAPPEFTAKTHVLLLNQSIKYCGSSRKDYLKTISTLSDTFNKYKEKDPMMILKNQVFNFLENPPQDWL